MIDQIKTFEDLYQHAIADWPQNIIVGEKLFYSDCTDDYIVQGLYELYESIDEKYINHPDESLIRELHYCLYGTLYKFAKYSADSNVLIIDKISLKQYFHSQLINSLSSPYECFTDDERSMIEKYLANEGEILPNF